MKIDTPKFAYPFKHGSYREHDSVDEVMDCVEVVLSTEVGEREEVPDYGLPDQAFLQGGADLVQIEQVLDEWEPRWGGALSRESLANFVDHVRVRVRGGGFAGS